MKSAARTATANKNIMSDNETKLTGSELFAIYTDRLNSITLTRRRMEQATDESERAKLAARLERRRAEFEEAERALLEHQRTVKCAED